MGVFISFPWRAAAPPPRFFAPKKKRKRKRKKKETKKEKEKKEKKKRKRKSKKERKETKKKRKKKQKKKRNKTQKKLKKQKEKRRVPRRAISAGHRVQEHNPSCYKWARRGEKSKLPSLLYDPLCACSHGMSRKQQQICACSVRAVVNVRARKHTGVRVYRARKLLRARAGCAGGVGKRA
jgi:flagellar biosynthesis GTPase FlhF